MCATFIGIMQWPTTHNVAMQYTRYCLFVDINAVEKKCLHSFCLQCCLIKYGSSDHWLTHQFSLNFEGRKSMSKWVFMVFAENTLDVHRRWNCVVVFSHYATVPREHVTCGIPECQWIWRRCGDVWSYQAIAPSHPITLSQCTIIDRAIPHYAKLLLSNQIYSYTWGHPLSNQITPYTWACPLSNQISVWPMWHV